MWAATTRPLRGGTARAPACGARGPVQPRGGRLPVSRSGDGAAWATKCAGVRPQGTCGCPVTTGRSCRPQTRPGRARRRSTVYRVTSRRRPPVRFTTTVPPTNSHVHVEWGCVWDIRLHVCNSERRCEHKLGRPGSRVGPAVSTRTRLSTCLGRARAPLSSARRRHRRRSNADMLSIAAARPTYVAPRLHALLCVCQSFDALHAWAARRMNRLALPTCLRPASCHSFMP